MKLNVYSIFDTASGLYSRPYFTQSDAEAVRSFTDVSTDADHPVGKHAEDYTLFRLGTFDDERGQLNDEVNESLCTALERIASTRNSARDNLEVFGTKNGEVTYDGQPTKAGGSE